MQYSSGVATGAKLGITVTTIQDTRACVFTSYNGVGDRREDAGNRVQR